MITRRLLLAASFALGIVPSAHAAVKLTPQTVVDLALSKGSRARSAELQAQRSYVTLYRALGKFDFQLEVTPYYSYSEAETLAAQNNLADRTFNVSGSLSKKLRTGTTLTLEYVNTQQNSTLAANARREPNATLNAVGLSLRQHLLGNAFGYADRLAVAIGEDTVEAALDTREEDLEEVLLDAMELFWNTYSAERELKENMAAREKYEALVKNARRKSGFNLSTPGELPRLQAELEGYERKVKTASAKYLNELQALLTAIKLETKDAVVLEIPNELPPVPQLAPKDVDSLRSVRAEKLKHKNAERTLAATISSTRPSLDLVLKGRSTGMEEENGRSLAEMTSNSKPYFYVGVEFKTALASDLARGTLADAEVGLRQAEVELAILTDQTRDRHASLGRDVASNYANAKSAIETVELRARVVREVEAAHRQGRQPLVELIRAYNDLFTAQVERVRAIGQYHISLNQLAAARDELVGANRAR